MRFLGSDEEVAIARPGHTQEFDAWRWADIGELPGLIVPFKRRVYEQLLGDFRHLARPQSLMTCLAALQARPALLCSLA